MCNIAILVSALNDKETLPVNFIQTLPKGVLLGGQKHGWHDTHYVEYMMSQIEQSQITGSRRLYLDHANFCKTRHNIKVKEIFNRKIANTKYPFPRPVQGNTVDFAITCRGAHLLNSECKSSENEGNEVLVFYLTQQLAWKKTTLSFLSSPRSMSLFKIEERPPNCGWLSVLEKNFPGFTIGSDAKEDGQVLVLCYFYMGDPPSPIDVPNG